MNNSNPESSPVNLVELIEKLAEPTEPIPVSMAPQTAGWVVLAAITLTVLILLAWRGYAHRRANAYRRAALAELDACGNDPAKIADILRRTALAAWPRQRVASLAGEDWIAFLDETGGGARFGDGLGKILIAAPYQSASAQAEPKLTKLAADWIRGHRAEAAP